MDISDIMWITMEKHLRKQIDNKCEEYQYSEKYHIKQFFDNNELTGFCVYHDSGNIRCLDEAHYIGKNPYVALKMWKWLSDGAKKMQLIAQKTNEKMWKSYIRMGFKIIKEDENNYLMERGG